LDSTVTIDIHHDLVEACKRGEQSAFRLLYQKYVKAMYNTARRMLVDEDIATDAVQDAFVTAFQKIHQYEGTATFGSWLKRITINQCLDVLKKNKRLPMEKMEEHTPEPIDIMEDFEWESHQIESIRKCMEQLSEGYRLVLSMYLFEGYDHAEIGEVLGINENTSKSQYHRAKKKLIELLQIRSRNGKE
jgi:RNA polymerase sigma factor (sigma-70 family)